MGPNNRRVGNFDLPEGQNSPSKIYNMAYFGQIVDQIVRIMLLNISVGTCPNGSLAIVGLA